MGNDAEVTPAAPEPGLEPEAVVTPPGEQVEPPQEPEQPSDTSARPTPNVELLQRSYTQSQQALSVVRKELGLSKDATPTQIAEAIRAVREQPADPETGEPLDARVIAAKAEAEAAHWDLQRAMFPGTAEAAQEFADLARSSRDPAALTAAFYSLLERFTAPPSEAAAALEANAVTATEHVEAGEIGETGASPAQATSDAAELAKLKGSGNIRAGLRHIPGLDRVIGVIES